MVPKLVKYYASQLFDYILGTNCDIIHLLCYLLNLNVQYHSDVIKSYAD